MASVRNYLIKGNKMGISDYKKVEEKTNEKILKICDYYNNHEGITVSKIAKDLKSNDSSVRMFLNRGKKLGYCNYDGKKVLEKSWENNTSKFGKRVEIFKDGKSLGIFPSCIELERQSEELFGVKLLHSGISQVANGKWEHYKKFTFKYVDKANDIDNISKSA